MKVEELIGRELDWYVALAMGFVMTDVPPDIDGKNAGRVLARSGLIEGGYKWPNRGAVGKYCFIDHYSTQWEYGGPIIDRERPELMPCWPYASGWYARSQHRPCDGDQYYGETALIAAMRAFVASRLGETIPQIGDFESLEK